MDGGTRGDRNAIIYGKHRDSLYKRQVRGVETRQSQRKYQGTKGNLPFPWQNGGSSLYESPNQYMG